MTKRIEKIVPIVKNNLAIIGKEEAMSDMVRLSLNNNCGSHSTTHLVIQAKPISLFK